MSSLSDKQNEADHRQIDINKVGVKGIRYPLLVLDRDNGSQSTVAELGMYVDLPRQYRGTHMSRFLEVLNEHGNEFHIDSISMLLAAIQKRLKARVAHIEVEFPYFIKKQAPVSRQTGLMDYTIRIEATLDGDKIDIVTLISAGVTTLCPCSKAISQHGAHNQRGKVTVSFRADKHIWFEEIIEIIELSASGSLYSLLKRVDEKYVTERAYETPVFVEDVARNVAVKLNSRSEISWYRVEAENMESIHSHNAYACVEKMLPDFSQQVPQC